MEKPLILIEQEMKEELAEVVNKYASQLPMTTILYTLKEMTVACDGIARNQLEQAKKQYESEVKENV